MVLISESLIILTATPMHMHAYRHTYQEARLILQLALLTYKHEGFYSAIKQSSERRIFHRRHCERYRHSSERRAKGL